MTSKLIKTTLTIGITITTGLALIPFHTAQAFNYVINDFNFYPTPNTPRPAKGVPFQDPVFHTTITRITDGPTDLGTNYVDPGYPKHDIENANGTKLFFQSYKYPGWQIWNANPPYNKIKDLPASITQDIDPDVRWDATDPDILYSTYGTKMYKYNVVTDEITLLHDFKNDDFNDSHIVRVYTAEEGDSSADSRYWAFILKANDPDRLSRGLDQWYEAGVIVYDKDYYGKDNGKIISKLLSGNSLFTDLNYSDISFDGNWVWCTEPGVVYSRDFSTKKFTKIAGHADRAISAEGRQVIFGAAHRYDGVYDLGDWTMMMDMESGQETWLTPMGKGSGAGHVSANSFEKPGWGLISVYGPTYPTVESSWDEHTIYLVELTTRTSPPPRVWMIAQTHTVRKDYSDDIFAKMNRKGTKIWFGSGWGQASSDPGAQYDVYQIDLPATWYSDLMSFNIITSSLSSGTVGSAYSQTLQASGGTTPYTWSLSSGSLPPGLSFNSSGLVSGTPSTAGIYTFTVRLTDAASQTLTKSISLTINPPPDATPPSTPVNLTANAISSSQINLSWTASTDNVGVTGYRTYRCQGSGCTPSTQIATASTNSYLDTYLSALTTYIYRVAAYDAAGNLSAQSASATAVTPSDTFPPIRSNGSPTGILPFGTTQTTLSLTTNESATCRYSTSPSTAYSSMTNNFSISYTPGNINGIDVATVTGLTNARAYNFYIRCQDTAGNVNIDDYLITFSVAASGTDTTPPAAPSGVTVN